MRFLYLVINIAPRVKREPIAPVSRKAESSAAAINTHIHIYIYIKSYDN